METATVEEKFQHAVELIKSLPKSGTFQPSNDMKLKFYSYFKQAVEGPCYQPKPSFWDLVSRAKWDAWNSLGHMAKEEAMEHYVDEFVQILKAAPFDDKAHDFVHIMGPYIDFAPKDFQEKYNKSNGNATFNSEAGDKHTRNYCKTSKPEDDSESSESSDEKQINGHNVNGSFESDSDEFSDTLDEVDEELIRSGVNQPILQSVKLDNITEVRGGKDKKIGRSDNSDSPMFGSSGDRGSDDRQRRGNDGPSRQYPNSNISGSGNGGRRNNDRNGSNELSTDVSEQLAFAVIRLQHTMEQVVNRLDSLEALLQEKKTANSMMVSPAPHSFWSIFGIPLHTAVFILGWPFLAHWLMYLIRRKQRK